ncbi:MAG: adenylyl-sulfate kinase [Clostridia bacterium]|nr:adenylyl-sulfate kinase [Clostridia bacterium]
MEQVMNIVTVGHVDHGKSTVIGRLMADTNTLPEGKLEAIREMCKRNSKPFEYAFLLDALKNEQAQGITIDTARCFFKSDKRRYIIIDAPGHIEFLKNMVTGASRAEAALLVIDASHGVEENTRRHGYFLSMLGIKQVAVLINKMDLVGYKQSVFEDIKSEYRQFLKKIDIEPSCFIPVSGMQGDNIASHSPNMPWYDGKDVLEQMDDFECAPLPENQPLRMPVQGVYKFTENNDSRRIIAGTVDAGRISAGDDIIFYPSRKTTRVKSLEVFSAPAPDSFSAGQAAGFTMTEQIFIQRGEIVCKAGEPEPHVGIRLRANIFWLGKKNLDQSRSYFFKCGCAHVRMELEKVERIVNASTLTSLSRQYVEKNEVAECVLKLDSPVAFDKAADNQSTGRFVIVDDYEIAGGGIITQALESELYDTRNIRVSPGRLTRSDRMRITGRRGLVVWMTGLSGAGKTTIASEVEKILVRRGIPAYVLDGDELRRGLCRDLGFSAEDRMTNIDRVTQVAKLFRNAGMVVLVSLISPYAKSREAARAEIGSDSFIEVYVKASVETCQKRDPKKLYEKAKSGGIANFTGLNEPYEEPENPDMVLDTETWNEVECVESLMGTIDDRLMNRR